MQNETLDVIVVRDKANHMKLHEVQAYPESPRRCGGPELRDHFAMTALAGLLIGKEKVDLDLVTTDAWSLADKMMLKR